MPLRLSRATSREEADEELRAGLAGACLLYSLPDPSSPHGAAHFALAVRLHREVRHASLSARPTDAARERRSETPPLAMQRQMSGSLSRLLGRPRPALAAAAAAAAAAPPAPLPAALPPPAALAHPPPPHPFLDDVAALVAELSRSRCYLDVPSDTVPHGVLRTLLVLRPFVVLPTRRLGFLLCYPAGGSLGLCALEIDVQAAEYTLLPCWPNLTVRLRATALSLREFVRMGRGARREKAKRGATWSGDESPVLRTQQGAMEQLKANGGALSSTMSACSSRMLWGAKGACPGLLCPRQGATEWGGRRLKEMSRWLGGGGRGVGGRKGLAGERRGAGRRLGGKLLDETASDGSTGGAPHAEAAPSDEPAAPPPASRASTPPPPPPAGFQVLLRSHRAVRQSASSTELRAASRRALRLSASSHALRPPPAEAPAAPAVRAALAAASSLAVRVAAMEGAVLEAEEAELSELLRSLWRRAEAEAGGEAEAEEWVGAGAMAALVEVLLLLRRGWRVVGEGSMRPEEREGGGEEGAAPSDAEDEAAWSSRSEESPAASLVEDVVLAMGRRVPAWRRLLDALPAAAVGAASAELCSLCLRGLALRAARPALLAALAAWRARAPLLRAFCGSGGVPLLVELLAADDDEPPLAADARRGEAERTAARAAACRLLAAALRDDPRAAPAAPLVDALVREEARACRPSPPPPPPPAAASPPRTPSTPPLAPRRPPPPPSRLLASALRPLAGGGAVLRLLCERLAAALAAPSSAELPAALRAAAVFLRHCAAAHTCAQLDGLLLPPLAAAARWAAGGVLPALRRADADAAVEWAERAVALLRLADAAAAAARAAAWPEGCALLLSWASLFTTPDAIAWHLELCTLLLPLDATPTPLAASARALRGGAALDEWCHALLDHTAECAHLLRPAPRDDSPQAWECLLAAAPSASPPRDRPSAWLPFWHAAHPLLSRLATRAYAPAGSWPLCAASESAVLSLLALPPPPALAAAAALVDALYRRFVGLYARLERLLAARRRHAAARRRHAAACARCLAALRALAAARALHATAPAFASLGVLRFLAAELSLEVDADAPPPPPWAARAAADAPHVSSDESDGEPSPPRPPPPPRLSPPVPRLLLAPPPAAAPPARRRSESSPAAPQGAPPPPPPPAAEEAARWASPSLVRSGPFASVCTAQESLPIFALPIERGRRFTPPPPRLPRSQPVSCGGMSESVYAHKRAARPFYESEALHLAALQLILCLLVTPSQMGLERGAVDKPLDDEGDAALIRQTPRASAALSPLLLLRAHLNHKSNAPLLAPLYHAAAEMGECHAHLLRLLCAAFFPPPLYRTGRCLARGAYGAVCACDLSPPLAPPCALAVKLVPVRVDRFSKSNLPEVLAEALVLLRLRAQPQVSQLFDFGTDGASFWLVMRRYDGTLRDWARGAARPLPHLLHAYAQAVDIAQMLARHCVNHFDIKADNFLIAPDDMPRDDPSVLDGAPRLVIADFGVSKLYAEAEEGYTSRDRGTEFIKSPEMLVVANKSHVPAGDDAGVNSRSDVWSIGCLLFEVLTGEYLFMEKDWTSFYLRVTSTDLPLLSEAKANLLAPSYAAEVAAFLHFVLQRDPSSRPTISEVSLHFASMRARLVGDAAAAPLPPPAARAAPFPRPPPAERCALRCRQALSAAPSPPLAMAELSEGVYLAARLPAARCAQLASAGVQQVVCFRRCLSAETLARLEGISVVQVDEPMCVEKTLGLLRELAASRGAVIVGDPRFSGPGSLAAAHLIVAKGFSAYEAILSVRDACPECTFDAEYLVLVEESIPGPTAARRSI
ncbi:hypothetical protein AB1Y20_020712 [Prymnesium parvum]|uniref:Protein kinase domain-containing protein n=1 Tax=Prymnesium parvum TaxID=97485 RepID=A0AB34JUE4_PRYPA